MALSPYAENVVLDHMFGTAAWTAPSSVWVRLHVGDPSSDGSTNAASNSTRKQLTMGSAVSGVVSNASDVSWDASETADETITHVSFWDAVTGGNCLVVGALSSAAASAAGFGLKFQSSTLTVTTVP